MAGKDDTYHTLENMLRDKKGKPLSLKLHILRAITNNFSQENLIGRGGYSDVYKGVLEDGFVAVKRLHSHLAIEEKIFQDEVKCMMNINHHNIVFFVGYCAVTHEEYEQYEGNNIFADRRERLLCFEYLRKGSLRNYLTEEQCRLPWYIRYQIIKGICLGLHYLHERRIIHLDLKPDNILLDDSMVPKIADFGLSRLLGEGKSRTITQNRIGTLGYMAPEYINYGEITVKSDIYSLGVIIKHVVMGCNTGETTDRDQDTGEIGYQKQMKACIEISEKCMHHEPEGRPSMQDILLTLEKTEAEVQSVVRPTPNVRLLELSKFGPWGGDEGNPRDIKIAPYHLDSITISSGTIIESIEFSYTDHEGLYHSEGPWGGCDGKNKIHLGPSEFLIGISGTIGPFKTLLNVVTSLTLVTNARSYGPFGKGRGTPFHFQMQSNGRIVGFFGRSAIYLNAIGVYTNQEVGVAWIGPSAGDRGVLQDITVKPHHLDHRQQHTAVTSGEHHKGEIAKFGPWGGDGGKQKDIKNLPYRLDRVTISSGTIIDSIEFSYSDEDGQYHTAGPWGGHGGDNNSFQLGPSEFLTGVSGSIGLHNKQTHAITSLKFVSNLRSYGPFGKGGGTLFHSPMQSVGCIVGFFGRSDRYLNAIGVYMNHTLGLIGQEDHNRQHHGVGPSGEHHTLEFAKFGPWGGGEGTPQDIKVLPYRLDRIAISSGPIIDSIEFSYTDQDGQDHTAGPWGGHGGDNNSFELGPSEFLTGVSGSIGLFNKILAITSLTFVTNLRSFGPFGKGQGTAFHIPMKSIGCIVGFFGRSGRYLNAIGVYTNHTLGIMGQEAGVARIGPWGGKGKVLHDITVKPHHLERVTIFSGSIINSLEYLYSDQNGQQHAAGPWGGVGGDGRKIQLDPEEFIVKVSGTFEPCPWDGSIPRVVSSLTFATSTGKLHGPFGTERGAAFHVPVQSNSRIVGFFAHAKNYIEAIGVYVRTL